MHIEKKLILSLKPLDNRKRRDRWSCKRLACHFFLVKIEIIVIHGEIILARLFLFYNLGRLWANINIKLGYKHFTKSVVYCKISKRLTQSMASSLLVYFSCSSSALLNIFPKWTHYNIFPSHYSINSTHIEVSLS